MQAGMPSGAQSHPRRSTRIASVDGLRAISVMMVVLSHQLLMDPGWVEGWFKEYLHVLLHGVLGVQFFFVISGFVITGSLLTDWDRLGRVSYLHFYRRRVFRLFPALTAFVALTAAGRAWFGETRVATACIASSLTMTEGVFRACDWDFAHLWSLTAEEFFYVGWPALFAVFLRRPRSIVLFFVLSSIAVRVWAKLQGNHGGAFANWLGVLRYFDHFALGAVLMLAKRRFPERIERWLLRRPRLCFIGAWLLIYVPQFVAHHGRLPLLTVPFGDLCKAFGMVLLLAHAVFLPRSRWSRLLSRDLVAGVGLISYSVYLVQEPFFGPELGRGLAFPLDVLAILLLAWASYAWIELPFQNLGRRFRLPSPVASG